MDTRDRTGGDIMDELMILARIQKIEASQLRTEAMLRTLIRDLLFEPPIVSQPKKLPNLSVIKTTH